MKIEKWTVGLAAAGLVSLSPTLVAQTPTPPPQVIPLQTALSATTISGYVDTSAVWNPGTGNANPAPYAFNAGKQDGFNVDAVDVKISRAEDESPWAAGYVAELSYGPDAEAIDGGAYPIRQAYVEMRMPLGNGLDWQLGRWDNLLGYESSDAMKDPNWTRSYGYTAEPTEHTGLLATYKFCDAFTLQAGVADTVTTSGINDRSEGGTAIESKKALVSLATLTAPDSWGAFKGSTLAAGFDDGAGAPSHNREELYVGTTINTPIKDLTFGASWDAIFHNDAFSENFATETFGDMDQGYFTAYAGYVSYKVTEKLTINGRAEYASGPTLGAWADGFNGIAAGDFGETGFVRFPSRLDKVFALTGTVQYDLWANVISRLEIRWDHAANGADAFGGTGAPGESDITGAPIGLANKKNEVMVAANVIYKF